jgi:xanthine dehydrogenase accessory factor
MKSEHLRALNAARRERRPAVLVTELSSGAQRFLSGVDIAADPLAEAVEAALRAGKSQTVEREGAAYFLTVEVPAVRLVMIGAVHISQALAPIARIAGLDPVVIDPRTAFASPERFPETTVLAQWPDEALEAQPLDGFTAIALLTHDPKIDDRALVRALKAECFYIGALGSRKTHAKRLERMRAEGFGDETLARIHAPIGLDIGAVSPAEIAVSICGEIIEAQRKKPLRAEKAN